MNLAHVSPAAPELTFFKRSNVAKKSIFMTSFNAAILRDPKAVDSQAFSSKLRTFLGSKIRGVGTVASFGSGEEFYDARENITLLLQVCDPVQNVCLACFLLC